MNQIQESGSIKRIAIIGGGISGLSAACYLQQQRSLLSPDLKESIELCLFESSSRVGGVIETLSTDLLPVDGLPNLKIVEKGADNFATLMPDALELSRLVGAQEMLIRPNQESRLARVVCRGKIYPIPEGFSLMQPAQLLPILKSPILSFAGKLRLLGEYFVSERISDGVSDGDESLKSFAIRRLGREAFDRLVEPIIGGIFTADAGLLSMQAAMPQFVEMERKFGGLIKAARCSAKSSSSRESNDTKDAHRHSQSSQKATGARYDQFMAPRDGMNAWLQKIANWLPSGVVQLNSNIQHISLDQDQRWSLHAKVSDIGLSPQAAEPFDAVIVATPSGVAARLISKVDPELSKCLAEIQYADSAVVCLCVERDEIAPEHHCFGIVVPRIEGRDCLAISLTSEKYPGRTSVDKVLLRIFMGGAVRPELMAKSDSELSDLAWREVQSLMHLKTKPIWQHVVRWPSAMPQYHLGHLARLQSLDARVDALPGLALAGNAYRGVGIPQCVRSGKIAAEKIFTRLLSE